MLETLSDKTMLLLEDNETFIEESKSLFKMFVKTIHIAQTPKEAFEIMNEHTIDLIITDIHLKKGNGLDFIKEVRTLDNNIPVIILSGHKDEEFLFKAMTLHLSGYLLKPINFHELIDAFQNCVERFKTNNISLVNLKDGYKYDKNLKKISKNGQFITLNKKEILFFEMIIENKSKIITKEMFATYVYADNEMTDNALKNFILRIRKKFGKDFLYTIPDMGYKMVL